MTHGTGYGYAVLGCRCDLCRAAQRARMREYRKRRMTSEANATTPGTTEKRPGVAGTTRGMASEATAPMRFEQYPPSGGGA